MADDFLKRQNKALLAALKALLASTTYSGSVGLDASMKRQKARDQARSIIAEVEGQ